MSLSMHCSLAAPMRESRAGPEPKLERGPCAVGIRWRSLLLRVPSAAQSWHCGAWGVVAVEVDVVGNEHGRRTRSLQSCPIGREAVEVWMSPRLGFGYGACPICCCGWC